MLRSGIICEMVLIRLGLTAQNVSTQCLMTDKRTHEIRPDGWRMTRNDNLHQWHSQREGLGVQTLPPIDKPPVKKGVHIYCLVIGKNNV